MDLIDRERLKKVFKRNTGHDYADLIDNAQKVDAVPIEVLDKIRAEITEYSMPDFEYHGCGGSQKIVELEDALEIIDKYKAESEMQK